MSRRELEELRHEAWLRGDDEAEAWYEAQMRIAK